MKTDQARTLSIGGALLLLAATFLPALYGPSIEGFLGADPNPHLTLRRGENAYQSWLQIGRGEQIVAVLAIVACLFFASKRWDKALRWAGTIALGSLLFGVVTAVNRTQKMTYWQLKRLQPGSNEDTAALIRDFGLSWAPQYGFFILLFGALLLTVAIVGLRPSAATEAETSPAATGRAQKRRLAMGVCLLAIVLLGANFLRREWAARREAERYAEIKAQSARDEEQRKSKQWIFGSVSAKNKDLFPVRPWRGDNARAVFSPDGRFLSALWGNWLMIWSLRSPGKSLQPMFLSPLEPGNWTDNIWTSPRQLWLTPSMAFDLDSNGRSWKLNSRPKTPYPGVLEAHIAPGEEHLTAREELVTASHAILWPTFDGAEGGNAGETRHGGRISLTSLPGGKAIPLHKEMRLARDTDRVTLAPRRPGGTLLAATQTDFFKLDQASGRLRVFDVTAGKKLWEKVLPAEPALGLAFSADARYLVAIGAPRQTLPAEGTNGVKAVGRDGFEVWDARSGRSLTRLKEEDVEVASLRMNGPKKAVVYFKAGSAQNSSPRLVARAIPSGKLVGRLEWKGQGEMPKLLVSPQGTEVALVEKQRIILLPWSALQRGQSEGRSLSPGAVSITGATP